jgi:hypothetical protein
MVSTESILEEYRRADFDKRLNLYLECPSLRTWFMQIDQGEMVGVCSRETSGEADPVVERSKYL